MFDVFRKIIFTHPPKCGGTSIEGLFGWHPSTHNDTDKLAYLEYFKKWKHASLNEHLNELQSIGEDISSYFIFSCVRNPWDRAVSWYFHNKIKEPIKFKKNNPDKALPEKLKAMQGASFDEFVILDYERVRCGGRNMLATKPFIFSDSGHTPHLIIRYENYLDELGAIANKFDLDMGAMTALNANSRPKTKHYTEYYSNYRSISLVANLCIDSINDFSYEF
jgi:hypothetical protein